MAKKKAKPQKGKPTEPPTSVSVGLPKSPKPRRKQGKPKEPIIGPEQLALIEKLWVRRKPLREIADVFGVHHATIAQHIERHIRPLWQKRLAADLDAELARIEAVEQEGWEEHDLKLVQWAIEQRLKIRGHYAPTKHAIEVGGELRVAGISPSELDKAMLERLKTAIAQRRAYDEALAAHAATG